MTIRVGPFVGVTDTTARIWFEAQPRTECVVTVTPPAGEPLQQGTVADDRGHALLEFTGLAPNTRYSYGITRTNAANLLKVSHASFATFPAPDTDVSFSFAFLSCHHPFSARDGKNMQLWKALGERCRLPLSVADPKTVRFLMGIGDQVYVDELWEKGGDGPPQKRLRGKDASYLEEEYRKIYREQLGIAPVRVAAASAPIFMTWDDHEIRDGWGSHGDEEKPACRAMFDAASRVYAEYQLRHNPYVDAAKGYYGFVFGKVGFVVLDLRRYRSARCKTLLGDDQWTWFEGWLKEHSHRCEVVFLVTSVPFIHLSGTLGDLIGKFPGMADDAIDQWTSDAYVTDGRRLAELLFGTANAEGVRFVILGGDVHVGTFAVVRSYRQAHEFHPAIYQFTSSPISNKPTGIEKYLEDLQGEVELSEDPPLKGRLLNVIPERNFGIVEVRRHPKRGGYAITFEIHTEDGPKRFATQW